MEGAELLSFQRPPELQKALGRLLSIAISDTSQVDVRERALLYYRLLRFDVQEVRLRGHAEPAALPAHACAHKPQAARVVNCPKVIVDSFAESEEGELRVRRARPHACVCAQG
jgi:hypothetical protein